MAGRHHDGPAPADVSRVAGVAGLLLTGGRSRRMGVDKAMIRVGDVTLAERTAAVLAAATAPTLEVGPGHSGLPSVVEAPPGGGPLCALAAGARALEDRGHAGPAVVLPTDLPHVEVDLVRRLAAHPAPGSVVVVVGGRPQWLVARWSPAALGRARDLVAAGERRMDALVLADAGADVTWLDGPRWTGQALDVDTPEDLDRAGLHRPARREVPPA
jgi:molybdopterin-guanine dinucleotide biosynthesis protein A